MGPGGSSCLMWGNIADDAFVQSISSTNEVTGSASLDATVNLNNPYVPQSIAVDGLGNSGLIWSAYVPQLWTLSPELAHTNTLSYGPFDGWNLMGQGVGPNGILRLLWVNWQGSAAVWTTDSSGNYVSDVPVGPVVGQAATALAVGQDNFARVLWAGTNGTATVTTVHPDGTTQTSTYGPMSAGYTAIDLSVDQDNKTQILWMGPSGAATLSKISSAGIVASTSVKAPGSYTVVGAGAGSDGFLRFLFRSRQGYARLYVVKGDGTVVSHTDYTTSETGGPPPPPI